MPCPLAPGAGAGAAADGAAEDCGAPVDWSALVDCSAAVDWSTLVDCSAAVDCSGLVDCDAPVEGSVPEDCGAGRACERAAHSAVARSVKLRVDSIVDDAVDVENQWLKS